MPEAETSAPKRKVAKPPMPPIIRERAELARENLRHSQAWAVPGFLATGGPHEYRFECPFRDDDAALWECLVFEALGTRSQSVFRYSLRVLSELCANQWKAQPDGEGEWQVDPVEMNTALAIVAACEAENEAQAAIAMQLAGLHFAGMKLAAASGRYSWGACERSAATQARIARTMASLQESLARMQGKLKPRAINQTIQVIYLDQRQQTAVLGGAADSGGQAHAHTEENRVEAVPCCTGLLAPLPSPCANDGQPLPSSGRERQARLPHAWGVAWLRRALGRA